LNLRGAFVFESRTNVFLSAKAEIAVETRQVFIAAVKQRNVKGFQDIYFLGTAFQPHGVEEKTRRL
jgi:hypothetical protein